MLPVRWDPFKNLSTLHREIDDMFRRTFGSQLESPIETDISMSPPVNTFIKENTLHIQAELPGVNVEDLDVSIDGNTLTLRGERKTSKETKEKDYILKESRFGSFVRKMSLPETANTEKIHASYKNGLLEITMPVEKAISGGRKVMIEMPEEKKKEVH